MSLESLVVDTISPSRTNPRKTFDAGALAELTESIKAHGLLQPILVRPYDPDAHQPIAKALGVGKRYIAHANGKTLPEFEIVAGERRWRAAKAAGLLEIPAIVRDLDDKAAVEIQVIENLQRADLHPLEEAEGYERLLRAHGYTADLLAAKVGKSKAYIYARMKLAALGEAGRNAFRNGEINASVALLVARIPVESVQDELLEEITDAYNPMAERDVRDLIHRRYLLQLKTAPFDVKDASLVPAAGPCAQCPKRTGNQQELFGDVKSADVCTDPTCFAAKKAAAGERKLQEATAAGKPILAPEKAKSVFSKYHDHDVTSDQWVDLAAKPTNELGWDWKKDWGQTLGAKAVKGLAVTVAVDPAGAVRELVPRKEALRALKAAGLKNKKDRSENDWQVKERKRARAKRDCLQIAMGAAPKIVGTFGAALLDVKCKHHKRAWTLLAAAVRHSANIDEATFVAKRRGWVTSQTETWNAIDKWFKGTPSVPDLRDFIFEILVASDWSSSHWDPQLSPEFKELAQLAGADLKAIAKAAATKPSKGADVLEEEER